MSIVSRLEASRMAIVQGRVLFFFYDDLQSLELMYTNCMHTV